MNKRHKEILSIIPKEVKTILDVGSIGDIFTDYQIITIDLDKKADVIQDLNKNQKLKFKDNSFDMVILSQILEHLTNIEEIISESKRVSKKYILIGLPNELKLDSRIKYLFGIAPKDTGYFPFGHKHFFTIKRIELFIKKFFKDYKIKKYVFGICGGSYLPDQVRNFLSKIKPSYFASEVYYLISQTLAGKGK